MKTVNDQKIRNLIKEKKVSVEKLAEFVDMTKSGLNKALNRGDLMVSTLIKISNYFEIEICELIIPETLKYINSLDKKTITKKRISNSLKDLYGALENLVDDIEYNSENDKNNNQ